MSDLRGIPAKTYTHLASQAGIIADQIVPRGEGDDEFKEARLLVVTYLRMAASKLRQVSEARALKEKG
jgi:hypothetical protein